jgi:hypothetical protein
MEDLKFKTAAQVMNNSNTPDRNADFYTNMNKGFAMAINGFRISVQWGPGNYFDLVPFNFDTEEYDKEMFDAQGGHIDQVFGHCSSDCVAKMIGCLAHSNDDDPRRAIKQIYDASF